MSNPVASVEIQAKSTGLAASLREARAKFGQFADGVATKFKGMAASGASKFREKLFGKAGKEKGGAFQHAIGNLASGAVSKVADFAVDAGKSAFDFQERLERLKIAANETPAVMAAWSKEMRNASNASGIGKDQVLGAAEAYLRLTGDVKTAREQTMTFAKVAQATGSVTSEIAETAAAMGQNMKVPAAEFENMFSVLAGQGKAGAIELKDLSAELSSIAPQWAQFGNGTGVRGLRELGAAMQTVKKGFGGDAAETTTGVSNFLTAVQKKGDRFKGLGVGSFFEKNGRDLKGVFAIVDQISKKNLRKDQLVKAFGSTEAYRAFIQLRDNRAEMEKLAEATQYAGVIQKDFNEYSSSAAGRTTKAWNNVKNAVGDAFTPERLEAFANGIEDLAQHVEGLVKTLSLVGSVLGKLNGVGKFIRGAIGGGNNNPFGQGIQMTPMENTALGIARASGDKAAEAKILDRQSARKGYDRSTENILAGETNERTSPESIRRAVMARFSENRGDSTAGNRYLANAFGSGQEVSDTVDKVSREMFATLGKELAAQLGLGNSDEMRKLLAEISANTAAGTKVSVDGNPIAKASKNAPVHRSKVAK